MQMNCTDWSTVGNKREYFNEPLKFNAGIFYINNCMLDRKLLTKSRTK